MVELKTLKDLEWEIISGVDYRRNTACRVSELRAEAVKWVKREMTEYADDCKWNRGWNDCMKEVFMDFFNLTEEDLK